jgi:hypothetical protein
LRSPSTIQRVLKFCAVLGLLVALALALRFGPAPLALTAFGEKGPPVPFSSDALSFEPTEKGTDRLANPGAPTGTLTPSASAPVVPTQLGVEDEVVPGCVAVLNLLDTHVPMEVLCALAQSGDLDIDEDQLACLEADGSVPAEILDCARQWVERDD